MSIQTEPEGPLADPPDPFAAPAPSAPAGHDRVRGVLTGLVVLLAAALVALVALTVYLGVRHSDQDSVASGSQQALAAATSEIVTVTSYNYKSFGTVVAAAKSALTPSFADKYVAVLDKDTEGPAEQYHVVVQATVEKSGIVTYGARNAEIMIFLDQASTDTEHAGTRLDGSRLLVQMHKSGSRWLIANVSAQ